MLRRVRRARAGALNFVFTRVVNHCVTVRLEPTPKVEIEMPLGKKTAPVQYLRAIRPGPGVVACRNGLLTTQR
jgi:hypothetical protein